MFLATTAKQEFWKPDEKILFLGEWCKLYGQKNSWSRLDYEVHSYHWDDRARFRRDCLESAVLYEQLLPEMVERLNAVHGTNHSLRYWRIVVGVWLRYLIDVLRDRYLSIRTAIDSGKATLTWIAPGHPGKAVALDFATFSHWCKNDDFNLYLYSRITERLGGLPFEIRDIPLDLKPLKGVMVTPGWKGIVKTLMVKTGQWIPSSRNRVVFVASFFKPFQLMKLQRALGQLPYPFAPRVLAGNFEVDPNLRQKILLSQGGDEFESLVREFIPHFLPLCYLEGFQELNDRALQTFPKNPRIIVSANDFLGRDGFKFWAAHSVERGAKLVAVQHGGGYGSRLWSTIEDHEIDVCDKYFSWGWDLENDSRVVPLSANKLVGLRQKVRPDPKGYVLWVGMSPPRYTYLNFSGAGGPRVLDHIQDQINFVKALPAQIRGNLVMRMYPLEFGWNEYERFHDLDPKLRLYRGPETMYAQLNKSRLCICTNNSTTFLECLATDFPTVVFWNPHHWELRGSAQPFFDDLVRAGVLHPTPEAAAKKVNEVYDDPLGWWMGKNVQDAVKKFCFRFARANGDWVEEWKEQLLKLMES